MERICMLYKIWEKRKKHIIFQNLVEACDMVLFSKLDIPEAGYEEIRGAFSKELDHAFQLGILTGMEKDQLLEEIKLIENETSLKNKIYDVKKQLEEIRGKKKYPFVFCVHGIPVREGLIIIFLLFGLLYVYIQ